MTNDLLATLAGLEQEIQNQSPELASVLSDMRGQKITLEEAIQRITAITTTNPQAGDLFRKTAEKITEQDLLGVRNPTNKLPQLNPLVEAALIERAQLDGDMPEYRTGPLPDGVLPAISVSTRAKNPVLVGKMLMEASSNVQEQIQGHELKRLQAIKASSETLQLMASHGALLTQRDQELDLVKYGTPETDHPSYRRGQVPAPYTNNRSIAGTELSALTKKEAQEYTWATISTSQGRNSLCPILQEGIIQRLTKLGFSITLQTQKEEKTPLSVSSWSISLAGTQSLQPTFSFVDIACMVISQGLIDALDDKTPRSLLLEVDSLLRADERIAGWYGKLYGS